MQMICSVYVIAGRRGARFIVVYKRTKWRTYFSPPEDLVSIVSLRNEVSLWSSLNDKERPMQLWRVLRMSVIGLHKRGTEGDRNIVGNKYVILYPAGGKREVLVCWRGFVRSFAVSLSFPNLSLESIKLEREKDIHKRNWKLQNRPLLSEFVLDRQRRKGKRWWISKLQLSFVSKVLQLPTNLQLHRCHLLDNYCLLIDL